MNFIAEGQVLMSRLDAEKLFEKLSKLDRLEALMLEIFQQKGVDESKPLTASQAREYLGKCKTSFYHLVKNGEIPFALSGKVKRFLKSDLDKYLNRNRTLGGGLATLLPEAKQYRRSGL